MNNLQVMAELRISDDERTASKVLVESISSLHLSLVLLRAT
jgi:hypothetical protein